jgi:hypothetical protein
MTDYQKYINALRKCAKEHENDRTSTGHIIVSDLCKDTANLLEEVEQQPRWIPVSERMPEEHKDVLTCGLGGFIEIQSFENAYDGYWENQSGARLDLDEVVAWMPLPSWVLPAPARPLPWPTLSRSCNDPPSS